MQWPMHREFMRTREKPHRIKAVSYTHLFEKQGVVFQDVIKYLNPQWGDIGQDMVSMFIDEMTSEEVLQAIDSRRETQAKAAGDEAWN